MDREPHRKTGNNVRTGFTAILCDDCEDDGQLPILAALRDTIRRCPHAVLVRANCPLGPLSCRAGKAAAPRTGGPIVLVQPCTSARKPVGAVMPVGPVHTAEDLTALTRWLETEPTTVDELPRRLRWSQTHQRQATWN